MQQSMSSAVLDGILFMGRLEHEFSIGQHKVVYNLATVGELQDALLMARGETNERAALMASSLVSVNGYYFKDKDAGSQWTEKYKWLRNLKGPVFDFFWSQYKFAEGMQYKAFEESMEKLKNSVPTPSSEVDGKLPESQG